MTILICHIRIVKEIKQYVFSSHNCFVLFCFNSQAATFNIDKYSKLILSLLGFKKPQGFFVFCVVFFWSYFTASYLIFFAESFHGFFSHWGALDLRSHIFCLQILSWYTHLVSCRKI